MVLNLYLVLPSPPSPTSISFVRLHSTDPNKSRFRKPMTALNPRRTISFGGVFRETQCLRCKASSEMQDKRCGLLAAKKILWPWQQECHISTL